MHILSQLKNLMPLGLMMKIKYRHEFAHSKQLKIGKCKRIYYLDAPDYGNLGDQAIAYAIRVFAEEYFTDYEFVEILQKDIAMYLKWLQSNIKKDDLIFLTGGGNMGNYYRIYEATRRLVISSFPENKVVIFPQSIMYSQNIWGRLSKKKASEIYNANSNLLVCAREKISYNEMKQLYKNVTLCPDIVLSLVGKLDVKVKKHKPIIGMCLREDIEQKLCEKDRASIREICKKTGMDVQSITTLTDEVPIDQSNRKDIVIRKIEEIAECKLLITDRLHAMIFSVIASTPCIVFKNNNAKITGTLKWIEDLKIVRLLDDIDKLQETINIMTKENYEVKQVMDYSTLAETIKGRIE